MTINRRDFLKGLMAAGSVAPFLSKSGWAKSDKPLNLLFIMTDQQPVNTLGCYGNTLNPTPNLDRLAKSGTRLNNFYIGAFPCSPSRASILTGCYPQKHGVFTNNLILEDSIPSLGFILRSAGYQTAYFGKSHLKGYMYRGEPGRKPHNGYWFYRKSPENKEFKLEQIKGGIGEDAPQLGFDTWAGGWKDYHQYLRKSGLGNLLEKAPYPGNHNDLPSAPNDAHRYSLLSEKDHMASFFTNKAVDFVNSRKNNGSPFCLFLSYFGPHLPVSPPIPWNKKYSLDQCQLPGNFYDTLKGKPASQKKNKYCYKQNEWGKQQFLDYIRRYYGYGAYIDDQIGRVFDALKKNNLEQDTIIIFTSDHGDMMGSHGYIYKMNDCGYQELARVPFIIKAPGTTRPNSVSNSKVSSVDIFPTVLELMGLKTPPGIDGKSFQGVLKNPGKNFRKDIFIHWGPQSVILFDGKWKYGLHAGAEMDELYNLHTDPGELKNLIRNQKLNALIKMKKNTLLSWLKETNHPYLPLFLKRLTT